MTASNEYHVSREDWSLHRKGHEDQARHQEKVNDAIRQNLPDLVSKEDMILSDGRKIIKIPIRSLDEYKFKYNDDKQKHAGQGDGDSEVGDVVARDGKPQPGSGQGDGVGDQPGEDVVEAEVDIAQLEEVLFAELELPNLKQKEKDQITVEDIKFQDIRKKGLMGNIDKKRTIIAAIRRNALKGKKKKDLLRIHEDDLRFKTWDEVLTPHSNAVILAMMDTSGSMGIFEKFCARTFFFWMARFLRKKYDNVEMVFIAHHTEAKEVTEEEFFSKGDSGGTICSSAYRKALEIIEKRYPVQRYNIYPIHFSDGDNLTSDNDRCLKLVEQLMTHANMFGYAEVNQYNRKSTLMSAYKHLDDERFRHAVIREKREVYDALKQIFTQEKVEVG